MRKEGIRMDMSVMCLMHNFIRFGFMFLSLFFGLLLQSTTGRDLKFVVAVFRHGDRTPIGTFPTNTVKKETWPEGYGQLTKIGMKQHYDLGKYIRKRYPKLLSAEYNQKEIYVQSTDYERTIMSAQANLAGLFRPIGCRALNNKVRWQPIPIHTVPRAQEKLLSYPTRTCKRFYVLLKETMAAKQTLGQVQSHMKFIAEMASFMGYDVKALLDFTNQKFWNAYDALLVQKIHKQPMPNWASCQAMRKMKKLLGFAVSAMFGVHKREEKSRLQGGVLVKAILDDIGKAADGASELKMKMYSGHDMTLVALQVALNVFDAKLPPYAACHFFELYKEDSGEHTIEMYYRTKPKAEPHPLTLPGCSKSCPLAKFKELVSPIIADNVEEECNKV
ncbi:prostatic acid phosphatase-like [Sceloporus undulatus]|uniref:prostatic acid phosphatase-like n=1 Tax=Sceloporus undulatus TaxID=8520 RepID=UPI001C4D1689|nr:prostatic acid phosphatase-like [Sceloporus undulatus]